MKSTQLARPVNHNVQAELLSHTKICVLIHRYKWLVTRTQFSRPTRNAFWRDGVSCVAATHQNVIVDDATSHVDHAITSIVRRNIPKVSRLLAGDGKFQNYRLRRLQAPALAPGVTKLAEEMLAMPGNVVTGAMTDKLGRMIFGSGDQTLRTTVLGNPSGVRKRSIRHGPAGRKIGNWRGRIDGCWQMDLGGFLAALSISQLGRGRCKPTVLSRTAAMVDF